MAHLKEFGYFYIHNRMPSSLFASLEDAENSADCVRLNDNRAISFYRVTKLATEKLHIQYIQTWERN